MPVLVLQTTQDPALSARTFSNNPTLHAALNRIRAQQQPAPTPAPTTPCPICGKWAHQVDDRYYHSEVIEMASGTRVEDRSEFCENVNTGAEVPGGDDASDPFDQPEERPITEDELNQMYLTATGWVCTVHNSFDSVWRDPLGGMHWFFAVALDMQSRRDSSGWSFTD